MASFLFSNLYRVIGPEKAISVVKIHVTPYTSLSWCRSSAFAHEPNVHFVSLHEPNDGHTRHWPPAQQTLETAPGGEMNIQCSVGKKISGGQSCSQNDDCVIKLHILEFICTDSRWDVTKNKYFVSVVFSRDKVLFFILLTFSKPASYFSFTAFQVFQIWEK